MEEPRQPRRRRQASPQPTLRRLRSLLPVSPLPWHWNRRIGRGVVVAIAALLAAGAVASVLVQRAADDEPGRKARAQLAAPKEIRRELRGLSAEQKAGQVVIAGLGDPAAAEREIAASTLGGVLIGPEDWTQGGPGQVDRLRGAAGSGSIPPLIAGAQEGGAHRALPDLPPAQGQSEIGAAGDPALARTTALAAAQAMKGAGLDLNLAPVADVATLDSPLGDRAYGDSSGLVAAMVGAAIDGCRSAGLACAVAHFPGEGAASADTARGPATVSLDAEELRARDLAPFRAAFKAGAPAAVISLAFYAAYDPVTPGALSPRIADELLRGELGFEGVAISDDLAGGAISASLGVEEAAVQAIAAGTDMVLISDAAAAVRARRAILSAVRRGSLSRDRLDEAVGRALGLKRGAGLM